MPPAQKAEGMQRRDIRARRRSDQENDGRPVIIDARCSVTSRDTPSNLAGWLRPAIVDAVTFLIGGLFVAAIIVIIVLQGVSRHRRLTRRAAEGQATLPRSTWIFFGVAAAFLIFAVFVFPSIVRR